MYPGGFPWSPPLLSREFVRRPCPGLSVILLLGILLAPASVGWTAAGTYAVTESSGDAVGSLAWAIEQASGNPTAQNVIALATSVSATSQFQIHANLILNGGGRMVDFGENDRAFLITGGMVTISNLTIQNAHVRGGDGADGGGGGAGLGGAILVVNGPAIPQSGIVMPSVVTLDGVLLKANTAEGGRGG